jgi:hypothetical protein
MKNSLVAMTDKILTSFLSHRSEVERCWDFSIQMFIDKIILLTHYYMILPREKQEKCQLKNNTPNLLIYKTKIIFIQESTMHEKMEIKSKRNYTREEQQPNRVNGLCLPH